MKETSQRMRTSDKRRDDIENVYKRRRIDGWLKRKRRTRHIIKYEKCY
jgi:hypothetical protein